MKPKTYAYFGGLVLAAIVVAIGGSHPLLRLTVGSTAHAQAGAGKYDTGPLHFLVDPDWPRPLPNNWIMGQVAGLAIDKYDNIWVYQRPRSLDTSETGAVQQPQRSQCCVPAPSVIEFNQAGEVINAWGGPDYIPGWPNSEHGILVDKQGYVWIGGNGAGDRQVRQYLGVSAPAFARHVGKRRGSNPATLAMLRPRTVGHRVQPSR